MDIRNNHCQNIIRIMLTFSPSSDIIILYWNITKHVLFSACFSEKTAPRKELIMFGSDANKRREYIANIENLSIYLLMDYPDSIGYTDPTCMSPHTHSYNELFVCGRGSITLQIEYGKIILNSGESMIIPAEYPHQKVNISDDALWYSVGYKYTKKQRYDTDDLYLFLDGFDRSDIVRKYMDDGSIFREVENMYNDPDTAPKHVPVMKMFLILMRLKDMKSIDISTGDQSKGIYGKTDIMSLLSNLDYFVYHKFTENISAADIAQRLCISERQLARIAKKRYGTTLHSAIMEKRISTACELLKSSNKTVEQISLDVGFQSKICFYREFAKKNGMTPIEYRRSDNPPITDKV